MTRTLLALAVAAWLLAWPPQVRAHNGPPFPVAVDRPAGPFIVSVWTDPDVGTGTFFVILAPAAGTALPDDTTVRVCVRPVSGRLPEACSPAVRQDLRHQVQYYAEAEFDRQELWGVRVLVSGAGEAGEVAFEVEATPPGFGAWDLLIYGFPFVVFGLLWLAVALRGRRGRGEPVPG